jgi:transcription elongation factor Elf1
METYRELETPLIVVLHCPTCEHACGRAIVRYETQPTKAICHNCEKCWQIQISTVEMEATYVDADGLTATETRQLKQ